MTSLSEAVADLRGIAKTLKRLEAQGLGLADAAQGLRRVANVLGVALEELGKMQREQVGVINMLGVLGVALEDLKKMQHEQMDIANTLGDHLLAHEREYPTGAELREYLAFMREERKKGAPLEGPDG